MTQEYILCTARPSMLKDIYRLTRAAFKEGSEGKLQIEAHKMKNVINALVRDEHQLAVVAMVGGVPKGVILGHVDSHAYCKGLVASDICTYVAPSLRGTKCASDLIEIYSDWCDRIPNLVGSSLSVSKINHTTPYMEAQYRAAGYSKCGITYLKLAD